MINNDPFELEDLRDEVITRNTLVFMAN